MNVDTNGLIRRLASHPDPVRRLAPPWRRTLYWLAIALPGVAFVVVLMSPRDDLAAKLADPRFLVEEAAALATAVAAAIAAFCSVVPGRDQRLALLPIPPLAVWLGSLGQGCLESWLGSGDGVWRIAPDWLCFPAIAIAGAIPGLAIVTMLQSGAPLAPRMTVMLGALAAAALGNVGLRLFHPQDASLMVLVWQFGSVAVLTALIGSMGSAILGWRHSRLT